MRNFYRISMAVVAAVVLLANPFTASAMTPTLSLAQANYSSDVVLVNVYGDPNASVYLNYYKTSYGYGIQSTHLGATNSSGYLSASVSISSLGVAQGTAAYVTVNNQQSQSVYWPSNNQNCNYYGGCTAGQVTLSQSSVNVGVGQSVNVTVFGGSGSYSMYASQQNIFQPVIAGNTLTITGLNNGNATLQVCSSGSGYTYEAPSSGCATLYVTVGGYSYPYPTPYPTPYPQYPSPSIITFSQPNVSLAMGQSTTVSISGGSASSYFIAYNSNSNGLSASISGSTLYLSAVSAYTGSNNVIVVCSMSNNCAALNVIVGGHVQGAQNNWTYCSAENGFCYFPGTQTVRYGANGQYYYRTATNGISCSNATFGDPIFGVAKQCAYGGTYGY